MISIEDLLGRLKGVEPSFHAKPEGPWTAFCPAHDDLHKRSLSIAAKGDRHLLYCFAGCKVITQILPALQLRPGDLFNLNGQPPAENERGDRRIVATYDYQDERGTRLYQVVRYEPKDFRPRRPDGAGGWIADLKGVRRVVYRLPELAEQRRLVWVEGEKDVDRLWSLGIAATTSPSGAASWRDDYAQQLAAVAIEEVVVIPDRDAPGRSYATTVATALQRRGIAVRLLELPGLAEHGDVSDWLDAGHQAPELRRLLDSAPVFTGTESEAPGEASAGRDKAAPQLLGEGAGQFLAREFPAQEPYIDGLLSADGGGWIAGEEKVGKTYYALEEALCLALKLPVCGRFEVPARRRVLFIEEEDPPRRTHIRLRALLRGHGLDPDDAELRAELDTSFRIAVWDGFTFQDPVMVGRFEATIAEFQPVVVYLDVLRKLTTADLNKAAEASAVLAVLDALRRRHGVVFRVLHHYRKVQGFRAGRGSQEIGGSFVLGAWAENSLFFEPLGRKQGAVKVEIQSKDGTTPAFRMTFETEGPRHAPTIVRLTAKDDRTADEPDEVVFQAVATLPKEPALAGQPGVSVAALAMTLRRSPKTIRRALKSLRDAERVVVIGQAAKGKDLFAVPESC